MTAGVAAALATAGCERSGEDAPPQPTQRVNAVKAEPERERPLAELCDVMPEADGAPAFTYPELSEASGTPPQGGWRWVNLWATWCKPCIEEMPLLRSWMSELDPGGGSMELVFVSADESPEALEDYRADHPDAPGDYRIADLEALPDWLTAVGLDRGATIPVHVVVDPRDRIRCVRSGSVSDDDLSLAKRLVE